MVTSCEFVHINPTVLGFLFNLERSRRLSVMAGALSLSRVMVAFSTVLLQSDISNSCHPHRSENQSNNLFIVVFGDGKKMVDEQLPILEVRLKECQPLCQFLIVDQI